jgi:hypothetical protein
MPEYRTFPKPPTRHIAKAGRRPAPDSPDRLIGQLTHLPPLFCREEAQKPQKNSGWHLLRLLHIFAAIRGGAEPQSAQLFSRISNSGISGDRRMPGMLVAQVVRLQAVPQTNATNVPGPSPSLLTSIIRGDPATRARPGLSPWTGRNRTRRCSPARHRNHFGTESCLRCK